MTRRGRTDEATDGRYTEATDAIDEEVDELGEWLHLDGEDANEEQLARSAPVRAGVWRPGHDCGDEH